MDGARVDCGPSNRAPDEHSETGWFTEKDVLSLRLADPASRGWIVQARDSGDPGACRAIRERVRNEMTRSGDDIPTIEEPDPLDPEDAAEVAPRDNETDFDDEQEEDQVPLDETEAAEAGVLLDDPEALSDEDG